MTTSEVHECPTCGKECNTERGVKIHHAQAHNESLAMTTRNCDNCGGEYSDVESRIGRYCSIECRTQGSRGDTVTKVCEHCSERFEIEQYRVESEPARFCSRECTDAHKSVEPTGENHPRWKGGRPKATCEVCDEEFTGIPGNPNRFCSRACQGEHKSNTQVGEGHPMWNGGKTVAHTCAQCGDMFHTHPGSTNPNRFCSRACKHEFQSGPTGWQWRGGEYPYGEGWNDRKKDRVRDAANYRCEGCGFHNLSHLEHYGISLHVHHKTPARQFDDPEKRNAFDNLVALCFPCHAKAERVAPLYPFAD